ncbi:hypothetical protein [Paenibacillus sp. USHLN196]|uniref:hypothetical protein n=1 Tax=Paenibacillus sp. USHLN196 TaxID=3081291 RepID=UPI003019F29A
MCARITEVKTILIFSFHGEYAVTEKVGIVFCMGSLLEFNAKQIRHDKVRGNETCSWRISGVVHDMA